MPPQDAPHDCWQSRSESSRPGAPSLFCSTTAKPSPISTPFHRVDAHHGVGDVGVEAVEHRLPTGLPARCAHDAHLGPTLFPSFLRARMYSSQRLQLARVGEEGVLLDLALVEPFRLDGAELGEKPTISMPCTCFRYFWRWRPPRPAWRSRGPRSGRRHGSHAGRTSGDRCSRRGRVGTDP